MSTMKQLTDDLQDRVIELLVTSLHFTPSHEPNIAIDAQAAILELRALPDVPIAQPVPEVNAMLVEALEGLCEFCEQAGFPANTAREAIASAKFSALLNPPAAAKQAQPSQYGSPELQALILNKLQQTQPARPINCGTGHCSCIECPYGQAQPERAPLSDAGWKEVAAICGCESITEIGRNEICKALGIKQGGQQ